MKGNNRRAGLTRQPQHYHYIVTCRFFLKSLYNMQHIVIQKQVDGYIYGFVLYMSNGLSSTVRTVPLGGSAGPL